MSGFSRKILAKGLLDIGDKLGTAVLEEGEERRHQAARMEERKYTEDQRMKQDALEWARQKSGRYTPEGRELSNREIDAMSAEEQGGLLSSIQVQDKFQQKRETEKREYEGKKPSDRYRAADGSIISEEDAKNLAENQLPMTDLEQQNKDRDYDLRKKEAERKGKDGGADTKITDGERRAFTSTLDRMLFAAYKSEKGTTATEQDLFDEDPSGGKRVNVDRILADASPALRARYERALIMGEEMLPQSSNKPGSVAAFAWQESETKRSSQSEQGMLTASSRRSPNADYVEPEKGEGKTVTKDMARQLLQEAGGDRDKARQLAKQRGLSW